MTVCTGFKTYFIGALVAFLLVLSGESARAAGDPDLLEQLVQPPLISAPSISADGHFLSGLHRQTDNSARVTIWRIDNGVDAGEALPYERLDINWMAWVGGGRLLLSLKENGLVLYDAHTQRLRPLIDAGGPRPGELPPFLLSQLHDDPTSILMQWEDPVEPGYPAVFKVNAITGQSEKIISAWRPIVRWWASPEGEISLGEGFVGRKQKLFARRQDGDWQQILAKDFFTGPAVNVLTVETGGATALVLSAHAGDTRALWRMHTASGEMINQLAGHPSYDITAALIDPVTDIVVGASYEESQRREIVWQPQNIAAQQAIEKRINVGKLILIASSRSGHRKLYQKRSASRPVAYYIYDSEDDQVILLPVNPGTEALPLVTTRNVFIPVPRMKRPMQAVLSQSKLGDTGKAIVLVHGGPVSRATGNYKAMVSWLTAAGYSVLQPNFRGSSGYGEAWRRAGYGEWGHRMQQDVRAAAQWLVANGTASAGDMCVMGGSYGGYAALMSAMMDDDLFACAVSLNGVSSLPHLIAYLNTNRFHMLTVPRIQGRLSLRTLKRRSPIYRADLMRMPILMLHSTEDANVPFEQSVLMAKALRKEGKEHEFIILKGAEHVLRRASERRIYMQNALDFIDKYLGQTPAANTSR